MEEVHSAAPDSKETEASGRYEFEKVDIKVVQSAEVAMMRCLRDICERHGLRYSIGFGSLIGAVRHHGFIPWDDDIDVLMPRDDYEVFARVAADELPDRYALQDFKMRNPASEGSFRYVLRILDRQTVLRLESYATGNVMPLWLDIFPLDGLPDNPLLERMHYLRVLRSKAICAFSVFDRGVVLNRPGRVWWQQLIIDFCKAFNFGSWFDVDDSLRSFDNALRRYPYGYGGHVFCGVPGAYEPWQTRWPLSSFERLEEYPFGDEVFLGPNHPEDVLGPTYGDYMALPPEDKRVVHQIEVARGVMCPSDASSECRDGGMGKGGVVSADEGATAVSVRLAARSNRFVRLAAAPFMITSRALADRAYRASGDGAYIRGMRDSRRGRRCFIVGNGPSLRTEDLDALVTEDSFGANRIYSVFQDTAWRPTYYLAMDREFIEEEWGRISGLSLPCMLLDQVARDRVGDKNPCVHYINRDRRYHLKQYSTDQFYFSTEPDRRICAGGTVTFVALQLALYMGYEEIYLVGMDHTFRRVVDSSGRVWDTGAVRDHAFDDPKGAVINPQFREGVEYAYWLARYYAEERGARIYNATRGGSLEVFERMDLDEVLGEISVPLSEG